MSSTNGGPVEATGSDSAPQLMVLAQYIKDLSFENPNAPRSLQQTAQPQINISVNVTANPLTDTEIEVTLKLEGKAESDGTVMFRIPCVHSVAAHATTINHATMSVKNDPTITSSRVALYCLMDTPFSTIDD